MTIFKKDKILMLGTEQGILLGQAEFPCFFRKKTAIKLLMVGFFLAFISAQTTLGITLNDIQGVIVPEGKIGWEKEALVTLDRYYERMTGKKLATLPFDSSRHAIFLGSAALKAGLVAPAEIRELGVDGYVLNVKNNRIGIVGKNSGVIYGVVALLKHFGLKYYGSQCEKLPESPIELSDISESRSPLFQSRMLGGWFGKFDSLKGIPLLMLGFSADDITGKRSNSPYPAWAWGKKDLYTYNRVHTLPSLVTNELSKTHPEYFARDKNGVVKHLKTGFSQYHLCHSNPEVQKIVYEKMRDWCLKTPDGVFYQLTQGDGYDWCDCENCQKMDKGVPWKNGHVSLSDRWYAFANPIIDKLQAEFPDKKFICFAYCATEPVPDVPVSKNINVMYWPYPGGGAQCQSHPLTCPKNKVFFDNLKKWLKKYPDLGRFMGDYGGNNSRDAKGFGAFFPNDALTVKVKLYARNNVIGMLYCDLPAMFSELFLFLHGKLLWKPETSEDELEKMENEFIDAYYGPAAPMMKEFLALIRKDLPCQMLYSNRSELLTPEYAKSAYDIFERAEKAVKDQQPYEERVKYEKLAGILFSDFVQTFTPKTPGEKLALLKELLNVFKEANATPKQDMTKLVGNRTGIFMTPSTLPWYDNPAFNALKTCKTLEDFKTLSQLLSDEKPKKLNVKTFSDSFKFYPSSALNRAFPDSTGEKRTCCLLQGGDKLTTSFLYESNTPFANGKLHLQGLDHDKEGAVKFKVLLNGKEVFNGKNTFSKTHWGTMDIPLPNNALSTGVNILEIVNLMTPGTHRNWLMLSQIQITPSNHPWETMFVSPDFNKKNGMEGIITQNHKEKGAESLTVAPDSIISYRGKPTIRIDMKRTKNKIAWRNAAEVWYEQPASLLKKDKCYRLSFAIRANQEANVMIASREMRQGHSGFIYDYPVKIGTTWKPLQYTFSVREPVKAKKITIPCVGLGDNTGNLSVWLSPITVEKQK